MMLPTNYLNVCLQRRIRQGVGQGDWRKSRQWERCDTAGDSGCYQKNPLCVRIVPEIVAEQKFESDAVD